MSSGACPINHIKKICAKTHSIARAHTHTHTHTHTLSVGLLWTSDQPDAEMSTWQHPTRTRDRHARLWRNSNLQYQQAKGRRLTPSRPLTPAQWTNFCTVVTSIQFKLFRHKFCFLWKPHEHSCTLWVRSKIFSKKLDGTLSSHWTFSS